MKKSVLYLTFLLLALPNLLQANQFDIAMLEYKQGHFDVALNLFDNSCKDGNKKGCYNLAVMYKYGQGVQKNRHKSKEYFSLACKGHLRNCNFNNLKNKG